MTVIACFSFRLFDYCWAAGRSIACDSGAEGGRPDGWLVGFTTATHMTAHERTQPSSLGPYIAKFPSGTGNREILRWFVWHVSCVGRWRAILGRTDERTSGGSAFQRVEAMAGLLDCVSRGRREEGGLGWVVKKQRGR